MAWVAPVVSAIASIVGGIMSKHNSDKARQQAQPLIDTQLQNMKDLGPWAKMFLGNGANASNSALNYYQNLLSGNRAGAVQAVAPEINTLNSQNTGLVNASRELYPRGGVNTATAANIPWQNKGAVNNLLMGVRPMAASQLGQMGGNLVSQGLGAMGLGSGLTNSMLNYGLQARQQQFDQGQAIGAGINGIYQNYLLSQMTSGNNNSNPNAKLPASGNTDNGSGFISMFGGG